MHQSSGRWQLGLGLSLLTVFLWGILPLALTIILQTLDVYTVVWFRFFISFVVLGIYLFSQHKLPTLAQLRASNWQLLSVSILGLAGNYFLFVQGLKLTSAANAEVIIQLAGVLLSCGGLIIFHERYTLYQWIGVAILTLGFTLFFHAQLDNLITAKSEYLLGSGLIVLGSISWAIYALSQKQLLQSLPSENIMLIIYGGCALLFTPLAKIKTIFSIDSFYFTNLLFCAFNTVFAYGAFAESLQHLPASRVSAILALAPIITLIAVWTISGIFPHIIPPENISPIGIIGTFLIVGGSISIALGKGN
ncbi:MAG: DMT family transporter [Cuspidothrix sp.]